MAHRMDLLAEVNDTLSGTGGYTGSWIESAGTQAVRVTFILPASATGQVFLEESTDQTATFEQIQVADRDEVALAARYFRLRVSGAVASTPIRASIRAAG